MPSKVSSQFVTELFSLLDLADLAVARCEGVLDDTDREEIASLAANLRARGGFVADFVVVALAGGTGSGKSSLLNALVSEPVTPVGVVRPTTAASTAVVPAASETDFTSLIRALGVDHVLRSDALSSTILVDLPDFDSVEVEHRHIVERVLPTVDAVLWIFDPEKYADAVVHKAFLSPMVPYEDQFVFVLNQVDRLAGDAGSVLADLEARLLDDGYREPVVVECVASGEVNVDDVVASIADRFDTKTTALAKAALDLRIGANVAWTRVLDSIVGDPDTNVDDRALAGATFVWLGVDAYDYWHSIERGRDARHGG